MENLTKSITVDYNIGRIIYDKIINYFSSYENITIKELVEIYSGFKIFEDSINETFYETFYASLNVKSFSDIRESCYYDPLHMTSCMALITVRFHYASSKNNVDERESYEVKINNLVKSVNVLSKRIEFLSNLLIEHTTLSDLTACCSRASDNDKL